MKNASCFSPDFEALLEKAQYTRWVLRRPFNEDNLYALLCMIGLFDAHARPILNLWFDDWPNLRFFHRPILALEALHQIARGERFSCERWPLRLTRGSAALKIDDLSGPARNTIARNAPGAAWSQVMEIDEGFELGGQDAEGQLLWAYVAIDGNLVYLGKNRRRGETTKTPAFSPALLERAKGDGRSRWAVQRVCAEDHLRCILWLAGEWNARSHLFFEPTRRTQLIDRKLSDGLVALEAMQSFVGFEYFDVAEFDRRIVCGSGHSRPQGLPVAAQSSLRERAIGEDFHAFVLACDLDGMERALAAGADPYAIDENGYTALQIAAQFGKLPSLRYLLEIPVDIDRSSPNGWSPLILALRHNRADAAALLLDAGADVNSSQPIGGVTPLMLAANYGNFQLVQRLLQLGANFRAVDQSGTNALAMARNALDATPSQSEAYAMIVSALEAAIEGSTET